MSDPYRKSRHDQGVDAKIVIMGNTGVGKTSLLHRYTQNKFDPKNTTSTTGAFFVTKKVYVDGIKVRLQLWDTAGQERFRSMAPMYYRGANAALLLYDITNASSFEDIRGWLEELKRNCSNDLIIYIVGSKADLHHHRQITSDLARLSLHNWFPPPRPQPLHRRLRRRHSPTSVPDSHRSRVISALKRSNTTAYTRPRAKSGGLLLPRANSTSAASRSSPARLGARYRTGGWNELEDGSSHTLNEDEEGDEAEDEEWGLHKGMELFEVSAKDDVGIEQLFNTLIAAIIARKDSIERENEMKRRDSVLLSTISTPAWAAQAEEEEAREKAREAAHTSWTCCST
ncbi:Ras-like GTP-binding protein RYL2 [Grifola frondosa]|uniref:Ras-like GTP-binding protein RYL2 n=1 Tax=Grifola frondosa TaxID=5627 RepID=A0A1C7MJV8_GRIFR|nr:Ras-like GTP-binding protein RYL2 [Grifola frondosa]